jgi:hypothetical protein
VREFLRARLFKAVYLAAFGVDSGHHMPYGTVLTRGIDALKDQENGVAAGGIMKLL